MDQELKGMTLQGTLKWIPFMGDKYLDIPQEKRMLVIGESHYNNGTEKSISSVDDINHTKIMIEEDAMGECRWPTKIIPNFHKAMFREDEFSKEDFWNLISYYNFIQRPMYTLNDKPSSDDFNKGWVSFFDLIEVLKPKICLFVGVSASKYLVEALQNTGFCMGEFENGDMINGTYGRSAILKDAEGNETKIIFIKHTSMFFSWLKWNSYLQYQMKAQFDWFENELEIKKKTQDYYGIFDVDSKRKLADIDIAVDKNILNMEVESANGKIEYFSPHICGEGFGFFKYKISINEITIFYEISIDDCSFESYYYGLKQKKIEKLEKIKSWYTYYDNDTVENIAKKVTNDIKEIIDLLK